MEAQMTYLKSFTIAIACATFGLAGCGGGDGGDRAPQLFTTQIFSDSGFDGDIEDTSPRTVTQGMTPSVQSVFAGIDPVTFTEFRAFLDFPLTGAGGVPGNAIIDSAFLEISVKDIQPTTGSIPILIELVSFQPPTLLESDFDRGLQPPLASTTISPPITQADVGANISIDVTSLMVEAQRLGLVDFQVRIMEDLGPAIPVLIEIDDTTGADRSLHAPLLTVTYF
jgi:hypothetical protein